MSSQLDLEQETDIEELMDSEETPPEAFYLALKNALIQLQNQPASYP